MPGGRGLGGLLSQEAEAIGPCAMVTCKSDTHPSSQHRTPTTLSLKQKVLHANALKVELITNGQSKSTMLKS